jgi:hypothetical protein
MEHEVHGLRAQNEGLLRENAALRDALERLREEVHGFAEHMDNTIDSFLRMKVCCVALQCWPFGPAIRFSLLSVDVLFLCGFLVFSLAIAFSLYPCLCLRFSSWSCSLLLLSLLG